MTRLAVIEARHAGSLESAEGFYRWLDAVHQDYPAILQAHQAAQNQLEFISRLILDIRTALEQGDHEIARHQLATAYDVATSTLAQ